MTKLKENVLKEYWKTYGGISALLRSPYFLISIILTLLFVGSWWNKQWWETSIALLPSLLGFSLGGYAMFVSVGSDDFKKIIAQKKNKKHSKFMQNNAMFMHFILLQITALIFALLASSISQNSVLIKFDYDFLSHAASLTLKNIFGFVGYFLLVYSILSALAAAFAIYKMAHLYDASVDNSNKNKSRFPEWNEEFKHSCGLDPDFLKNLKDLFNSDFDKLNTSQISFGNQYELLNESEGVFELTLKGKLYKTIVERLEQA